MPQPSQKQVGFSNAVLNVNYYEAVKCRCLKNVVLDVSFSWTTYNVSVIEARIESFKTSLVTVLKQNLKNIFI